MSIQADATTRNALLDSIETAVGTSPKLEFRTGGPPANCAAADTGTLLVNMTLPADWMAAASSGAKALAGTWAANAEAFGGGNQVAAHWRIKTSGGTTRLQGAIMQTGGTTLNSCTTVAGNTSVTAPANSVPNLSLVSGSGIVAGTYVVSGGGTTTLVLSQPPTSSGTPNLTFTGTISLVNTNIAPNQPVSISSFDLTAPHA